MPVVELDQDVYDVLLRRAVRIGEDASSILRRELGLGEPTSAGNGHVRTKEIESDVGELGEFLQSPTFLRCSTATDRYLTVLGWLAQQHEGSFEEKVLGLGGRSRRYFGRTKADITRSGTSTHPHRIPGTQWWAMTNADTPWKRETMRKVTQLLGYPSHVADVAGSAIR